MGWRLSQRLDLGGVCGWRNCPRSCGSASLETLIVDDVQPLQPLLVAVPILAHGDDVALQGIEGGEQRCGAVALVVAMIVPQRPFFIGKPG